MSLGAAFMEYCPSRSLVVTVLVPLIKIFTPGAGILSFAEVTIPVTI